MAELQLANSPELECNFVIDDILSEDKEISLDDTHPELQFTKFLYAFRFIEREMEKMKLNAENMIGEINSWLDKKLASKQNQIDFMCKLMQNYLAQKGLKSLALPSGNIGFRKQPDKVEIIDVDTFFEKATFDLIRVVPEKFEPDLAAIKAKIKENGELPAGVDLVTPDPKFYYKLNGKE
jgi:hypothetical protein